MIEPDEALDLYASRCNIAPHPPAIWSAHWHQGRVVGELGLPADLGKPVDLIFGVLMPFISDQVHTSIMVYNPGLIEPEVNMTRLAVEDGGIRTTHWIVPYSLDDWGRMGFGPPVMRLWELPGLEHITTKIVDNRSGRFGFAVMYHAAVSAINEILV